MTRSMNQRLQCPNCGILHTAETPFERWMRESKLLRSDMGIVRYDLDVLLHRYKFLNDKFGGRTVQALMFIEVKSMGAEPDEAQLDTLSLLSQTMRNRRANRHRKKLGKHLSNHSPIAKAYSRKLDREVSLWMFGGHLLTMESESPEKSEWLTWDYKTINCESLIGLLRFELDPDTIQPIDWRRRTYTQQTLFQNRAAE